MKRICSERLLDRTFTQENIEHMGQFQIFLDTQPEALFSMTILKIAHIQSLPNVDPSVLAFKLTRNRCDQNIPTVIALICLSKQRGPFSSSE